MILAEGLRSQGFDSFVAPGPNGQICRVLIGPLPDPQAYRQGDGGVAAIIEPSPMLTRQARTREEYQQWCDFACARRQGSEVLIRLESL